MTISSEAGNAKARTRSVGAAIQVRGLRKVHHGVAAVDGVDLKVRRGEIFGLLGPEGAGKTTMLEMIEGREKPDAGVVEVAGRVAVRPRDAAVFDSLTLHETLATFADLHDEDYSPTRVRELLEKTSLSDRAGSTVGDLSDNEKQRFSLALALVDEPEIIVLDDPAAGLDRGARREIWETVRRIRAAGATVVLALEDVEEAGELCNRVALMDRGRIVAHSAPRLSTQGREPQPRFALTG